MPAHFKYSHLLWNFRRFILNNANVILVFKHNLFILHYANNYTWFVNQSEENALGRYLRRIIVIHDNQYGPSIFIKKKNRLVGQEKSIINVYKGYFEIFDSKGCTLTRISQLNITLGSLNPYFTYGGLLG